MLLRQLQRLIFSDRNAMLGDRDVVFGCCRNLHLAGTLLHMSECWAETVPSSSSTYGQASQAAATRGIAFPQ